MKELKIYGTRSTGEFSFVASAGEGLPVNAFNTLMQVLKCSVSHSSENNTFDYTFPITL